jgi:hypothetical protein
MTPSPFVPLPLGGEGGILKKEGLAPLLNAPWGDIFWDKSRG